MRVKFKPLIYKTKKGNSNRGAAPDPVLLLLFFSVSFFGGGTDGVKIKPQLALPE